MIPRLWLVAVALLAACAPIPPSSTGDPSVADLPAQPDFDAWWDYGDPAATRARFVELEPAAAASGDADYHLQLLTQIARTLGLEGQFDEAHARLDRVESELDAATPVARLRYLLERGRAWRSAGQPERARPLFEEAYRRGRETGADYHAVDAAHMVAITVDDTEDRRRWSLLGIDIAAASEQPKARHWLGSIRNNLGWDYHEAGEYTRALEMFEQALEARREEGDEGAIGIARWCVGRCNRSLGRFDEALQIQLALLTEYGAAGKEDGYVHEEIGEIYLHQDRREEATPHFGQAWKLLSADAWLMANESERLERIRLLAGLNPE
jgi:tetratricopeptide (TPR) repeat protein